MLSVTKLKDQLKGTLIVHTNLTIIQIQVDIIAKLKITCSYYIKYFWAQISSGI